MHRKVVAGIAAVVVIVGGMAEPTIQNKIEVNNLPAQEKLKAATEDIFNVTTLDDIVATQDAQGDFTTTTMKQVHYLYKDTVMQDISGEIVSRRTQNTRTIQEGEKMAVFFDAVTPYYQDAKGNWWNTSEATTTPEAFDLQTKENPILGALFPSVNAQTTTFLTTGAGSGNQTFNVPADWNNSNNQVACIGSGSTGGVVNSSGGGGGAYASSTNLTLTPGGTATYAIGASATTTVATVTVGNARSTYFNGTSSSTASVSCDWGRFPTFNVTVPGGSTAYSIGTTKFAGGNSGAHASGAGGSGGGGSGGMKGAGKDGAVGTVNAASGGGGSDGGSSSAGSPASGTTGGNGGNGSAGTGAGIGGTSGNGGGNATTNSGGGGGGAGGNATNPGGNGAIDQSFDSTHGAGGGGGGGAGAGASSGGSGGTYGGGGGQASSGGGTGGTGGQGLIVIIYTPAAAPTVIESPILKVTNGLIKTTGGLLKIKSTN